MPVVSGAVDEKGTSSSSGSGKNNTSSSSVTAAATRDSESKQQLAQALNTVRLLEARLKEKEDSLNQLEQDKDKLETFSRSTLVSFKVKIMNELNKLKEERDGMQKHMKRNEEKMEKSEGTSKTEQRLIMAALYELGGKIMDRNIGTSVVSGTTGIGGGTATANTIYKGKGSASLSPSTFLCVQNGAQIRNLDSQLLAASTQPAGTA